MNNTRANLSCKEIRSWDIVGFLRGLGHEPAKIKRCDYWYLSPLRNERSPSFKVDRSLNRWYDHGIGKGGNLVDFCLLYYRCTVSQLLEILSTNVCFQKHDTQVFTPKLFSSKLIIEQVRSISSRSLINYLSGRKIPMAIAERYCHEVHYSSAGNSYYALGMRNDQGGYELRSACFKGSSSPKSITTIINRSDTVCVFEGMFDFLSYMAIKQTNSKEDHIVLNSLSFFEKARPLMEQHSDINLYLDLDTTGQNCSRLAVAQNPKYCDKSGIYKGHKDFNHWLVADDRIIPHKLRSGDFDNVLRSENNNI